MDHFLLIQNIEKLPLEEVVKHGKGRFQQRTGLPASHVTLPPGQHPERIARLKVRQSHKLRQGQIEISTEYSKGDVVCSYCGVVLRHDPAINGVSHGACEPCLEVELSKIN